VWSFAEKAVETHSLIPEFGDKQPAMRNVDRQMIDAASNIANGNLGIQDQWSAFGCRAS
jgi:hypothetical protein